MTSRWNRTGRSLLRFVLPLLLLSLLTSPAQSAVFPAQGGSPDTWGTELRNFFSPYYDLATGEPVKVEIPSSTFAGLPAPGEPGRLARVTDGIRGIWKDTGTAWVSVTGWADVRDWGFSATASDATNATALQGAIDSDAAVVFLPPGSYSYSGAGLTIDRVVHFRGGGSSGAHGNSAGQPGAATTKLTYTGTGVGITLVGSGTEGKENIHLSDFALWGTASATGGILIGNSTFVLNSSIRNVQVRNFTQTGAYGFKFAGCLLSYFQNLISHNNYDGFLFQGTNTTLTFQGTRAYDNLRNGYRILNLAGGTFIGQNDAESNDYEGLYMYGSGAQKIDFVSFYSEANNTVGGTAPVVITGSAVDGSPTYINFFGGSWADAVSGRTFDLDYADRISWYNPTLTTYNPGFMRVTANTTTSDFYTWADSIRFDSITGNVGNKIRVMAGGSMTRIRSIGSALVAGDIALSAGWGTTATVSAISGTDQRLRFTVTSAGTGQGASPTATLTFHDGTWTAAPFAVCSRNGGNQAAVLPSWTTTATTLVLTFPFTPTATETYSVECIVMG